MANTNMFRQAWGKFATGVAVVTTIEPGGQIHGMAANSISSVALEPLLVLVCIGHVRNSYQLIKESGRFAINFLGEHQQAICEYYASPPEQRSGDVGVSFSFTELGSAILDGCVAAMDCHVVDEHIAGDHSVFIGGVDEIQVNEGRPLISYEGGFGRLA